MRLYSDRMTEFINNFKIIHTANQCYEVFSKNRCGDIFLIQTISKLLRVISQKRHPTNTHQKTDLGVFVRKIKMELQKGRLIKL